MGSYQCRALRKRIEVLEKSNAVTSKQAPSSKSLVDKLEAEVTELRRQTSGDQQKVRHSLVGITFDKSA
jgi:hypothetical protein